MQEQQIFKLILDFIFWTHSPYLLGFEIFLNSTTTLKIMQ